MITIIKIPFDACIVERARRGTAKGPNSVEVELRKLGEFEKVKGKIDFSEVK